MVRAGGPLGAHVVDGPVVAIHKRAEDALVAEGWTVLPVVHVVRGEPLTIGAETGGGHRIPEADEALERSWIAGNLLREKIGRAERVHGENLEGHQHAGRLAGNDRAVDSIARDEVAGRAGVLHRDGRVSVVPRAVRPVAQGHRGGAIGIKTPC